VADNTLFAAYPAYWANLERLETTDPSVLAKEVEDLFAGYRGRVDVRGAYSTIGLTPHADLMFWWVADSADDIQSLTAELRRTELGRGLVQAHAFLGLVRPAEFAKDHLPAFAQGKAPLKYACVYPFVRTPEWYLLDPEERGSVLREHGEAGREFPEVQANTTSAFGLGDYEWILAFEAERIDLIVDLIRRLRATEARRYTKLETPFVTGIRKALPAVIEDLA
jgi:peroxiredoxin